MVLSMHPSRDVVLSFFNSIAGRAAVAIHVDVHSFMTLSRVVICMLLGGCTCSGSLLPSFVVVCIMHVPWCL